MSAPINTVRKKHAAELLDTLLTGTGAGLRHVATDRFVDHEAEAMGARDDLLERRQGEREGAEVTRALEDGDYVVLHSLVDENSTARFDIFEFDGATVMAHWANVQRARATPSPGGHCMADGPTEIRDLDKTVFNKWRAQQYVEDILIQRRLEKLTDYFAGDRYIQHSPQVADDLSGPGATLQQLAKPDLVVRYDRIHKVLGEGNFTLVVSEGEMGTRPAFFYDLFRLEADRIAEHWDTVQLIPADAQRRGGEHSVGLGV
jgi:predicted SnoaL-like aldol condensation-catalyzing enzyme